MLLIHFLNSVDMNFPYLFLVPASGLEPAIDEMENIARSPFASHSFVAISYFRGMPGYLRPTESVPWPGHQRRGSGGCIKTRLR